MHYLKIYEEAKKIRPVLATFLVLSVFLGISALIQFQTPDIFDPDSFYHIRHAWLLKENGIFNTDFPWIQYSIVKTAGADMWYGYHLFLIPFTFFEDLTIGIKIAGLLTTFAVLTAIYYALKNLKIRFAEFWPIMFVFINHTMLFRMAMTRPHPLSLVLGVLVFSFFISGSAWLVFIFSFLLAWIHATLFWLPMLPIGFVVIFKFLENRKIDWTKLGALAGGLLTGLFLRPNPIENLKLIYVVIVDIYRLKSDILEPVIGRELTPASWQGAGNVFLPIIILMVFSVVMMIRSNIKKESVSQNIKLITLSMLSASLVSFFLVLDTRRAIDFLSLFAIALAAGVTHYAWPQIKSWFSKDGLKIVYFIIFIFVFFTMYNSSRLFLKNSIPGALKKYRFQGPALWLKENTNPGEIVFHPMWDQFPSLFYWNQNNYYIWGMDPVLTYKYDEKIYWKNFYIVYKDMAGLTCGVQNCGPDDIELVYDYLRNDLKASYVFTRKITHPRFLAYLEGDKLHFEKVYDQELSLIFKILPPSNTKK